MQGRAVEGWGGQWRAGEDTHPPLTPGEELAVGGVKVHVTSPRVGAWGTLRSASS